MLYLFLALLVGALIPVQTAANARLRLAVNNRPIVSALISFTVALTLAAVATLILQGHVVPHFLSTPPPWAYLSGLFGATFVIGNIVLFPKLGAVQTVVLPILGQVIMGLAIDHFGLFRGRQVDVSVFRLGGALVVLLGIAVVLRVLPLKRGTAPAAISEDPDLGASVWVYRLLGVAIGVGSAMQAAINGYVGTLAGSPLFASEINLLVGAVILLVAVLCTSPRQLVTPLKPAPWWMWLGGVVGAIFVIGGAGLTPILGTATTVIAFNAGTIASGQLMESVGAFGARRVPMDGVRLVGLAIIFAGVLMVRML